MDFVALLHDSNQLMGSFVDSWAKDSGKGTRAFVSSALLCLFAAYQCMNKAASTSGKSFKEDQCTHLEIRLKNVLGNSGSFSSFQMIGYWYEARREDGQTEDDDDAHGD